MQNSILRLNDAQSYLYLSNFPIYIIQIYYWLIIINVDKMIFNNMIVSNNNV